MNRNVRNTLSIQWDFRNMAIDAEDIEDFIPELSVYMGIIFPKLERLHGIVYGSGMGWDVQNLMRRAQFEVKQCPLLQCRPSTS